jgi:hypothetical protein
MGYSDVRTSGQGTQRETMFLYKSSHFSYCVEVYSHFEFLVNTLKRHVRTGAQGVDPQDRRLP